MKLKVTYKIGSDCYHIMANQKQRISETIRVMEEALVLPVDCQTIDSAFSWRLGKSISTEKTYEEAGIFTGDILKIDGGE